jgi:ribose transport system ATP-binding protein
MTQITKNQASHFGAAPGLLMEGISKSFPGTLALDKVDFNVAVGEVHGLVGENGAGKSTLIKILSGLYTADEGRISLGGQELIINKPADAEAAGIYVIHQDRQLVPMLSVAESLFLGRDEVKSGLVFSQAAINRRAQLALKDLLDLDINPKTLISELSVAHQQLIQIARAMMVSPKLVIFDEPTAPLAQAEVQKLFSVVTNLKNQGVSVVYISHYLQEVRFICERVTVLRNGIKVGELELASSSLEDIVQLMVGRDVQEFDARTQRSPKSDPAISVIDLKSGSLAGISFEVRPGEVVGVTGLIGSGADELPKALMGLQASRSGKVSINGTMMNRLNPVSVVKRGIAYVPADRRREGAIMAMDLRENLSLTATKRFSLAGWIRKSKEKTATSAVYERLGVRSAGITTLASSLSGGNQQKIVFGKWLVAESQIFLLDSPTSGVDIGSRAEIYKIIDSLTDQGSATLLITQDLEELVGISDRIIVLYRGKIAHEFDRADATVDAVLAVSTGAAL